MLDEGLRGGLGVYRSMAEGAQQGAESLSSDPLQVLSEFVQNANDAQAGQLRFLWSPDALLIAHDGVPVRPGDILLLGMPWLSGKTTDARSTGRFGIGLSTLRALATTWEVHHHPFHVRYAGLSLEPAARPELPEEISGPRWTVFRIPLEPEQLPADQLFTWFESWSDASLLFLRHLERVEVTDGNRSIVLALSWKEAGHTHAGVGGRDTSVTVRNATTSEGTVWRVYEAQVPPHSEWKRHNKALGAEVPVTVALPLQDLHHGCVHAGLPVAPLDMAARVHSQFDPVASREGFAGSQLNQQLVPLIADLWEAAVRDVLAHVDPAAWHLIPLPSSGRAMPQGQLQDLIRTALQTRARQSLTVDLVLPASDDGPLVPLSEFAVEEAALTGVVDDTELTRLAGVSYAFPPAARDRASRWRRVLSDWRAAGAELRPEVRVTDALVLFGDADREVVRTVRLAAVTIESGHGLELMHKPCLVTKDGRVLAPFDTRHAYAEGPVDATGPLDLLKVVHDLHPAYWAEDSGAKGVIEWLRNHGRLIRRNDTAGVLRIVSRLGELGGRLPDVGEAQEIARLTALQRALGDLTKTARNTLGPGIGRAVRLNGFSFDSQGKEKPHKVEPSAAYLSAALESADGDRFAVAARKTPGLVWVHRSYARSLLSATQGNGLSRTAFLRLLGVADTPRLTPVPRARFHHTYFKEYAADLRTGLSRQFMWSLTGRRDAMSEKGAQYTLDDLVSDDLQAVVTDIMAEQDVDERRRRTAALLRTLAGPLTSSDARVPMARADRKWLVRGETSALWVWQLRDTAWLEDTTGSLRAPTALQLRTPDAEALYGHSDPDYLHGHIQRALATRTEVLTSLGVSGDPDVPRLTARLHELRKRTQDGDELGDGLRVEALLVYRALARRLTDRSAEVPRSEVERQIRRAFTAEALVLTDQGWKTTNACFRGAAVLRGFRPFTFNEPALEPLWRFLGVGEPEVEDLADVLKEISRQGDAPDGQAQQAMLNALRCLRDRLATADGQVPLGVRNKLRPLPLWTTSGWTRTRPVYAVDHVGVERSLAERLPLWTPGGDTRQFASLFGLLRVTPLDVVDAQVINAHHAVPDRALTEDFHRAVIGLQDLLVRDEPEVAESFSDWDWLAGLEVRLHPNLQISLEPDGALEPIEVSVEAHISRKQAGVVFLRSAESLQTKRGAGTAIASLFPERRQRVGHRWRDVWEEHLADLTVKTALTSTRQQDREEQRRLDDQLRRREQEIPASRPAPIVPTSRSANGVPARPPVSAPPSTALLSSPPPSPQPMPPPSARLLVDAAAFDERTFTVTTTDAPSEGTSSHSPSTRTGGSAPRSSCLPPPRPGGAPPREQSGPLGYRDADKERRVLHALRRILREEGIDLEDQRGVSGFGADALDSTGRYFEFKAHGGAVPPELSLTRAEFKRALAEGNNYVLVIASHLEKDTGTPTLRLIPDPVNSFEIELPTEVRLMDVRNMHVASTVYQWPSVD
ncbi:hypothetical protein [Streptomyces sp. NPDC096068]|uniref:sacsin N-terminal ATP-binding-like domain-containing protein n=1 Tax=Streptomyces sp. NPDC096068 TaxID=3155424 RepID=UPI00331E32A8